MAKQASQTNIGKILPKIGKVSREQCDTYVRLLLNDAFRDADPKSYERAARVISRKTGISASRLDNFRRGRSNPHPHEFINLQRTLEIIEDKAGVIDGSDFGLLVHVRQVTIDRTSNKHPLFQAMIGTWRLHATSAGVPHVDALVANINQLPVSIALHIEHTPGGLIVRRQQVVDQTNLSHCQLRDRPLDEHRWPQLVQAVTTATMSSIGLGTVYCAEMTHFLGSRKAMCDFITLPVTNHPGQLADGVLILGLDLVAPAELSKQIPSISPNSSDRKISEEHFANPSLPKIKAFKQEARLFETVRPDQSIGCARATSNCDEASNVAPKCHTGKPNTATDQDIEAKTLEVVTAGSCTLKSVVARLYADAIGDRQISGLSSVPTDGVIPDGSAG